MYRYQVLEDGSAIHQQVAVKKEHLSTVGATWTIHQNGGFQLQFEPCQLGATTEQRDTTASSKAEAAH